MVLADLETKAVDPESWTLLMDEENNLAEVLYGNLFVVRGGKLRTPGGRTILEGITRSTTMHLAGQEGIEVHEQAVQPYDLYTAEEAFITTTSYVILPVSKFNGSKVGDEIPGPITRQLTEAWKRLVGMDFVEQMQRYAVRATLPGPIAARSAGGR
jgi:branched-chain amino acid aminotransferase